MPAVDQDWASNVGVVLPSVATSLTDAWELLRTDVVASPNFDGMVLFHEAPLIGPALDPTFVTSMQCDPVVATQRRRLRR
jgi:hypothetical protein